MPRDTFTNKALDNLMYLVESKGNLIGNVFDSDSPKPVITKDAVSFPKKGVCELEEIIFRIAIV
jgi:hypothetical protein